MFGLGMMLQEHVDYSKEGQPLYDSTWDYKIPTAACIPRQFNIALLKVCAQAPLTCTAGRVMMGVAVCLLLAMQPSFMSYLVQRLWLGQGSIKLSW